MLHFLPAALRGLIGASLLALNTLFWCWPLFFLALLKLLLPIPELQRWIGDRMHAIAEGWISAHKVGMGADASAKGAACPGSFMAGGAPPRVGRRTG